MSSDNVPFSRRTGKGGRFTYRRRVPRDMVEAVGAEFWKIALKTDDPAVARVKAGALAEEHDRLIVEHGSKSNAHKIRDAIKTRGAKGKDAMPLFMQLLSEAAKEVSRLTADQREILRDGGGLFNLLQGVQLYEAFALPVLKMPDSDSDPRPAHVRRRESALDAVDAEDNRSRRKVLETIDVLSPDKGESIVETPDNPLLTTVFEKWVKHQKQDANTVKRHRVSLRRFIELHGNVLAKEVTQKQALEFRDFLSTLPDTRSLPPKWRGLTVEALRKKGIVSPPSPAILPPTQEKTLATLRALFRWCISNVPGFGSVNVFRDVSPGKDNRKKNDRRREFTPKELSTVLDGLEKHFAGRGGRYASRHADMIWLVWLGTYSGLRIEEACQLARANVRQVRGIWCLDINDRDGRHLKNEFSNRTIPIHPVLIDRGFIDFATKGKGDRVFSSFGRHKTVGKFSPPASTAFGGYLTKIGLDDPALVFHSLRHRFATALRDASVSYDCQLAIMGRSDEVSKSHGGYGSKVGVEAMAAAMVAVDPLKDVEA